MKGYEDCKNEESRVESYEIGEDYIIVKFKNDLSKACEYFYEYTYEYTGREHVEQMKVLVEKGEVKYLYK
ncbi:MAG: hypothetical protein LBR09_00015 [Endomicrobium sp.]|jgi:hypothetical protein|nr:hypothetical protein [Endomicrobium sp.]